jgi:hypothetical protein
MESPQPTFLKTVSRSLLSTLCISCNKAIKKPNTQSQTKKQESKGRANGWQTGRILISRWRTCYSIDHEELWCPGKEQDNGLRGSCIVQPQFVELLRRKLSFRDMFGIQAQGGPDSLSTIATNAEAKMAAVAVSVCACAYLCAPSCVCLLSFPHRLVLWCLYSCDNHCSC